MPVHIFGICMYCKSQERHSTQCTTTYTQRNTWRGHLVIWDGQHWENEAQCVCQIHPSNQTAGFKNANKGARRQHKRFEMIFWNHYIQTASHQTAPWMWKYTQLTSSPSLTLPLQTGLSRPEKELSQQLWLSGHQRKCQKQFLTLGSSQWIFYLFDLKLTHLLHIFDTSKQIFIIWFKLLPVFLFRCVHECCFNARLSLGPHKKSQIATIVAQKVVTPLILHLHTFFSRLLIEEKDQPINCFLFAVRFGTHWIVNM